ncbi:hypothetical protein BDN70DRAFT_913626 [Pholiota conissans]|uniref:PHD-type domain-containing protein n=1 Tax=Pholiota conissans TaxID=109636 RepID=A0A9P5Z0P4_9AGAR|nr:hypothetical protein BDN70DRAFT_913626 [Pholiota conissans]
MTTLNTGQVGAVASNESSQALLPPFSTTQYSHLPTPQSPKNFDRYIHGSPHTPETPVPQNSNHRATHRRLDSEGHPARFQPNPQQCITPESSPHASHTSLSRHNSLTSRYIVPPASNEFTTPKQPVKSMSSSLETHDATNLHMATSSSHLPEQLGHSSILSSPFMAKLSIASTNKEKLSKEVPLVPNVNTTSFSEIASISAAATAPPSQSPAANPGPMAGGEMERIRQSMLEDRMAQIREAEKRRPEYLKRTKRTLSEADPSYFDNEDNVHDPDSAPAIGIMESPHKGRRLKLFQETSEESFEESLMAGGYGRYRTADWVRQPQPISLPSSAIAGSSNIVSILEEAEELPPTEKELKKRKRLAAFKSQATQSPSKLHAVELEGKGRVLLDIMAEEHGNSSIPELTPNKKRVNNRRKKKNADTLITKKPHALSDSLDDQGEKPNWPDAEFPWRLRTEERVELAKAEEEDRMKWIERFLDRDSDDEGDLESNSQRQHQYTESASQYGLMYEKQPEKLFAIGRGKMVPMPVYSDNTAKLLKRIAFPSDPADARTALMSKRSVRALSYRQQKRQRELDDEEDDETVCICNGKDDGRELVQCDACQTWYHLECIGIKSISELGREEDPWFCRRCVARSPSPTPSHGVENLIASEPTFAPTDNEPNVRRVLDTSFFPPGLQESPNWASVRAPRTPTRSSMVSDYSQSWTDSSRPGPSTPQQSSSTIRVYSSPLDGYSHSYDESPFDPTSTPSRGIRFQAPFTPKNNAWPPRTSLFQTPSKAAGHGPSNMTNDSNIPYQTTLGHAEISNVSISDAFGRPISFDDSPVRRSKLQDNAAIHRVIQSPPRHRPLTQSYLEESPIVRQVNHQDHVKDEHGQHGASFEGVHKHNDDTIL